jgi:5-methylcytosine-specific restriction endonuclease McrA
MKTLADLLRLGDDSEETRKRLVWQKGRAIPGIDAGQWRYDDDNNLMCYTEYGQYTEYGWQIDHQIATALGGSDAYANLRPLHWRGNSQRGALVGALMNKR